MNAYQPLSRFSLFATTDVEEARTRVAKVYCDHRLTPVRREPQLNAWATMANLGALSVGAIGYGADVEVDPGNLENFYVLILPYRGQVAISNAAQQAILQPGGGAMLNPDGNTLMHWSAECAALMVRIERVALENELSSMLGGIPARRLCFDLEIARGDRDTRFRSIVQLLVSDLEAARKPATRSTALCGSLLLANLLEHQPNNFAERLGARQGGAVPRQVRAVEDFVEANAERDLSIDDLVSVSGVSSRALFEAFRKFRGISPVAYVRLVRMNKAREDLRRAGESTTVTEVALRWGFSQLGRFAVQYRKTFGELPSETLRNGGRLPTNSMSERA